MLFTVDEGIHKASYMYRWYWDPSELLRMARIVFHLRISIMFDSYSVDHLHGLNLQLY